ncbi:YdcF family protein [Rhodococcoides yunnanense]|uniref:YdcF family protein n=1 Tax=Rhodococcoides yunnanense TaxID=278209 RepID=A0ABU4BB59_9NOCA|nr:YdcF family protein [Rhodococcus yunnanensis]MDV6261447.1 YdcF family protein [Rhodococcus yunnanensis]
MRSGRAQPTIRVAVVTCAAALALVAGMGAAMAQPDPSTAKTDTSTQVTAVTDAPRSADAQQYNDAQNALVKGRYDAGFAALDAVEAAAPNDANVAALQTFYANATADADARAQHSARLRTLSPMLADAVDRAIAVIDRAATETIDFAPATDGPRTAIVVLGLGLNSDGSMAPELVERLHFAVAVAERSPESPIVVTGGNPQSGITEAEAMKKWLIDNDIAADRIHTEATANSTVQNAQRATSLAAEIGAVNLVLATTPSHLRRAISDFEIAGADVIGAATATPDDLPDLPALVPTARLGMTVDATKILGIPRTY